MTDSQTYRPTKDERLGKIRASLDEAEETMNEALEGVEGAEHLTDEGTEDYIALAGAIAKVRHNWGGNRDVIRDVAFAIAGVLEADNPRFDRQRFLKATGSNERRARVRNGPGYGWGWHPRNVKIISAYLPANYSAVVEASGSVLIQGYDDAGWTLDGYVIPRLASRLIFAEEVD